MALVKILPRIITVENKNFETYFDFEKSTILNEGDTIDC